MRCWVSRLCDFCGRAFESHRRFAHTRWAVGLMAAWSFFEALVWFILPDYLILLLAMLASRRLWTWVWVSVLFSLLGTLVMMSLVAAWPESMAQVIFHLPFTHERMPQRIEAMSQGWGVLSAVMQPFSLVPVKVWTYSALEHLHWDPMVYLLMLGLGRGVRMILVGSVGVIAARVFEAPLKHGWLVWVSLYTLVFLLALAWTSRLSLG